MTQAPPLRETSSAPAERVWPHRALAAGLALLTGGLVLAVTLWPNLAVPAQGDGGASVWRLIAGLWRSPGETPATMASIAFGSAWGASALGAVAGWLTTAAQALRGRAAVPLRAASVLTFAFLLLGFVLASAWTTIARWLSQLSSEGATGIDLTSFGWAAVVIAAGQSATATALGVTPRRPAAALLPVLVVAVLAGFAGSDVIVAGGGSTPPPAQLTVAALSGDGPSRWLAAATLVALAGFAVAAWSADRRRAQPGRLWLRLTAVLALAVTGLTAALLILVNQSYLAAAGGAGWPVTPYLPITLCGAIAAALAVAVLLVPDRARQPAPAAPSGGPA